MFHQHPQLCVLNRYKQQSRRCEAVCAQDILYIASRSVCRAEILHYANQRLPGKLTCFEVHLVLNDITL